MDPGLETIRWLSDAARARGHRLLAALGDHDPLTLAHAGRVRRFALAVGRHLGLDAADLGRLAVAALFHDIGKLALPRRVLRKPGRLTPAEYRLVRSHPGRGGAVVWALTGCPVVHAAVRGHHERYDGSGYPDRLRGDEIPFLARILAVADAFDAMTSPRPYRQPVPWSAAREAVLAGAGGHFHPHIATAFAAAVRQPEG